MAKEVGVRKVLMFPWLAHGHVFPFFELSKKLSKNNFQVYFLSTAINLDSLKKTLKNTDEFSIEFIELHLPSSHELPPHYHTTKNIPPHLMPKLIEAFQSWSPSFPGLIACLKPDLLIYDGFQPWAAKACSSQGVPSVLFSATGSASLSFFHHVYSLKNFDTYPFDEIYIRDYEMKNLVKDSGSIDDGDDEDEGFVLGMFKLSSEIILIKSCNIEVEAKYSNYLSSLCKKKMVPVGPLVSCDNSHEDPSEKEIMGWLSTKSHHSTLYISFGSENYLSNVQMMEIAKGLERTNVNFIWVVRTPPDCSGINVEEILPKGFVDRVKGRGMVVRDWAPQARILAHPSTGGFMSHCGWSSVTEGLYYGVPILGLPLKVDQPINCRFTVATGVGIEVMRDKGNGDLSDEEVVKAVNRVFVDKETGDSIRRKAKELGEKMKMEEDEATREAVEELSRLCMKRV